jgi:predicted acyltransferase
LAQASPKWWWASLVAILVGYWGAFVLYPSPGTDFNYAAAGASPDWAYNFTGFAAHWNKNVNPAWAFDTWFLNLWPREKAFRFSHDNYSTLSFIPTLATMILGLIAGDWLKKSMPAWRKIGLLTLTGGLCLAAGMACHDYGICPIVKKIWTPAWVLYSGGWAFLILAGFYLVIDVIGFGFWAFPLRVIGMNSIAAYCMAHLFQNFMVSSMQIHLGKDFFLKWGKEYEHFAIGIGVLLLYWLILFWMYRRKIFLRV